MHLVNGAGDELMRPPPGEHRSARCRPQARGHPRRPLGAGPAKPTTAPRGLGSSCVSDQALTVTARIPDQLQQVVADKVALAEREGVAERLRSADATLWGPPDAPEISNRLGWLTIAERMLDRVDDFQTFAEAVRDDGFRDLVLLGMGGSSLAPEVMRRSFAQQPGWPRLQVLDSTDAAAIRAVQEAIDPRRTLFLVSSKSG